MLVAYESRLSVPSGALPEPLMPSIRADFVLFLWQCREVLAVACLRHM